MSRPDDYEGGMTHSEFVDQDVERLVAGRTPEDPRLADIAPWIHILRTGAPIAPSSDASARAAERAARIVRDNLEAERSGKQREVIARPDRRPSWSPARAAFAFGGMALLAAMIAFGTIAHQSNPGDPLYGVDIALESVGIGSGEVDERIEEADALLARGDQVMALKLLGETLEEASADSDDQGVSQTRRVLATATTVPPGTRSEIRTAVEKLSRFIEANGGAGIGLDGAQYQRALNDLAATNG